MKKITKPNWNLCMEERLMILKNPREKRVTVMNNELDIYGACQKKMTFHQFLPITDDII